MKLKRIMVFIIVIAIMITACTPQKNDGTSRLAKKSQDIDIQEIREFLIKADNLVFDELSDEEAMDFLQERGEGGNTEIIAVEEHSIIYSFENPHKVSPRCENILSILSKYYENKWDRIAQLRRAGIVYVKGKVGCAPILMGGSRDVIEEDSDIKILNVEKGGYGNDIITCSVEKKYDFYLDNTTRSTFYIYQLARLKNGDYLIIDDGSLKTWRKVNTKVAGYVGAVEGETYVDGHPPRALNDGNITTNWIGNNETSGLGETLTFNFRKPVMLQSMLIINGSIGSIETNKITKVKIELSNGEEIIKKLQHRYLGHLGNAYELINLSDFETTEYVKLTILGIEESDENNPVGISDVYFFSKGVLYD